VHQRRLGWVHREDHDVVLEHVVGAIAVQHAVVDVAVGDRRHRDAGRREGVGQPPPGLAQPELPGEVADHVDAERLGPTRG